MAISMAINFFLPLAQILLVLTISIEISPKIVNNQPLIIHGTSNLASFHPKRDESRTRKNPRKSNQKFRASMVIGLKLKANECPKWRRKQNNQQRRRGSRGITANKYDRAMKPFKLRRVIVGSSEGLWLKIRTTIGCCLPSHNRRCSKTARGGLRHHQDGNTRHEGVFKGNSDAFSKTEAVISSLLEQTRCTSFLFYLFYVQFYEKLFECLKIINKLNPPGYSRGFWPLNVLCCNQVGVLQSGLNSVFEQFFMEQLSEQQPPVEEISGTNKQPPVEEISGSNSGKPTTVYKAEKSGVKFVENTTTYYGVRKKKEVGLLIACSIRLRDVMIIWCCMIHHVINDICKRHSVLISNSFLRTWCLVCLEWFGSEVCKGCFVLTKWKKYLNNKKQSMKKNKFKFVFCEIYLIFLYLANDKAYLKLQLLWHFCCTICSCALVVIKLAMNIKFHDGLYNLCIQCSLLWKLYTTNFLTLADDASLLAIRKVFKSIWFLTK